MTGDQRDNSINNTVHINDDMNITNINNTIINSDPKNEVNLNEIIEENEQLKDMFDNLKQLKNRLNNIKKNNSGLLTDIVNKNNKMFILSKIYNEGFHEISKELLKVHEVQLEKLVSSK